MLGHCTFLVTASDMVNRMPIPGLMEHIASDYADYLQPSASFHYYGTVLMTLPRWLFNVGASIVTILVDIIMLGHCMLLVFVSDMVNRMPIPDLIKCIASDYAESCSRK